MFYHDCFWLNTRLIFSCFYFRVENAEVLCLGIVSVAVFMLVLPLFKATGNILLQIAPGNVAPSAFIKCGRQVNSTLVAIHFSHFRTVGGVVSQLTWLLFSRLQLMRISLSYARVDFGSLYLAMLSVASQFR
jgi:hypothetical protein